MLNTRIKILRNEKGLSQRELAKMLNLSSSTIAMYETGKRKPDSETLEKIAQFFNVSTDYLLGLSSERSPADKILMDDKNKKVEIKELLDRYNVMLEGEPLDENAKDSVIELLKFLRDRDKKKKED